MVPIRLIRLELARALDPAPLHVYRHQPPWIDVPAAVVKVPTSIVRHRTLSGGGAALDWIITLQVGVQAGVEQAQQDLDELVELVPDLIELHDPAGLWRQAVVHTITNYRTTTQGDDTLEVVGLAVDLVVGITSKGL